MGVEIAFDLLDHTVIGATTDGRREALPLGPMSVAEFHASFLDLIGNLAARRSSTVAQMKFLIRYRFEMTGERGPTTPTR